MIGEENFLLSVSSSFKQFYPFNKAASCFVPAILSLFGVLNPLHIYKTPDPPDLHPKQKHVACFCSQFCFGLFFSSWGPKSIKTGVRNGRLLWPFLHAATSSSLNNPSYHVLVFVCILISSAVCKSMSFQQHIPANF